eukprot:2790649-Alexandrium_andersonii.AAC.1
MLSSAPLLPDRPYRALAGIVLKGRSPLGLAPGAFNNFELAARSGHRVAAIRKNGNQGPRNASADPPG